MPRESIFTRVLDRLLASKVDNIIHVLTKALARLQRLEARQAERAAAAEKAAQAARDEQSRAARIRGRLSDLID